MKKIRCGDPRVEDVGEEVVLAGWVAHRRDHGGLVFVDLRDETGLIQVRADPGSHAFEVADRSRPEWVVEVRGVVRERPEGTVNSELETGEVEVEAAEMTTLAEAKTPPFAVDDRVSVDESLRLKYRYLDLRRPKMQRILRARSKITWAIRVAMEEQGFVEVETPTLTRPTPEGARDYLVPSRRTPGEAYALAQSPQLYKQLLMVAGIGRYYQLARCWRDEDPRADRQHEFTQLDMEMSFASADDVISAIEPAVAAAAEAAGHPRPETPFERITWAESMRRFGTDKPDLRIREEIVPLSDVFEETEFKAFGKALSAGGLVAGLRIPGRGRGASRSFTDGLVEKAKSLGAAGLVWMISEGDADLRSPVAKFLRREELEGVANSLGTSEGDLVLIVADEAETALEVLGSLRSELCAPTEEQLRWCWVTDFPLVRWNHTEGRLDPLHHPFCAPHPDDLELLRSGADAIRDAGPERVRALAYDLVVDGWELGSGSVRIHDRSLQRTVFEVIGLGDDEAEEKFGFLLEAFEYGAPPHAGFAMGLDRLVAKLLGEEAIRDVIAFPKTQVGAEPMTGAPAPAGRDQLDALGLEVKKVRSRG